MQIPSSLSKLLLTATTALALTACGASEPASTETDKVSETSETSSATKFAENTILQKWTGPYDGVPQWDKVKVSDFPEAFQVTMDKVKAEVNAIRDNPAAPTFANFTEPMELAGNDASELFSIWGVHSSNLSTPEVRKIQGEWLPKVSAFFNQLTLDPKILEKTKAVYDTRTSANLDAQQLRLVERNYEELVRNGALLQGADKEKLIALNTELSKQFNTFSNKVLADEETYIYLTEEAELAGLPDSFIASLAAAAEAKGKTGWALKNTRSVMQPFLQNSTRRDLRERVFKAYVNRGDNGDANDTNATIAKILSIRAERAKLLGFKSHAHYRMADTMAKEPETAMNLMLSLIHISEPTRPY